MNPFIQNVLLTILSALCGGCATIIAYAIKHRDEKKDKHDAKYEEILQRIDKMSDDSDKRIEAMSDAVGKQVSDMADSLNGRIDKMDARIDLICKFDRGTGRDRITHLGNMYIKRGGYTITESENIRDNLYEPYKMLGGNGSAKDIMDRLSKIDIIDETEKDRRDIILNTGGNRYWEEKKND